MAIGILGRKVGMTQIYDEAGKVIPVTVIEAGPCHVLQLRTKDRDGYEAVQLGFLDKPRRKASRSERGHVAPLGGKRAKKMSASGREAAAKAKCEPKRFVRELRGPAMSIAIKEKVKGEDGAEAEQVKETRPIVVGDVVDLSILATIQRVDVTGTSIGRGTSGVMRRHNFKGQRATHGVKKVHRQGGSYGCRTFPGRVFKGKRMAGRYGNEKSTMRNLRVVKIELEKNLLLVRGAVPGPNGGMLVVRETNKFQPKPGAAPASKKKKK
jgi:large subunit ribosomal protein L3